ncbi:hypothetical protein pf16_163 [Pseudomonas phage pf16]|uniref:Nicotinamide phosphoribosyltransferase n=1 Tax=Pseudomonas phage pf16 TaxID=1815630 RepID=A0A1S5R424_9CAUD|nr:nicotinamide phosphoribosyl transferase [Pseudomonas phage pf16]AND75086.1 hypothetical protein pf16_163 [Pseudomonas phage pf16]
MFKLRPQHATDVYKLGHRAMLRQGTNFLYQNFTPRADRLFKGGPLYDNKIVLFGITGFVQEFLVEGFNEQFFNKPKAEVVAKFKRRCDKLIAEGAIPVDGFEQLHDLGYLPLLVLALPEGSRVDMKIPVMTIQNTHPDFAWLPNYIEPTESNMIWKSCTNATIAYEYRRVFEHFADITGANRDLIIWQGHDFSSRGMSGPEDSARSGAAHMVPFCGTDNVSAVDYLEDYYGANVDTELVGGSVPATEHSISSSNILFHARDIRKENPDLDEDAVLLQAEKRFLLDYITRIVPTGIASYVADTYDYWGVLTKLLPDPEVKAAIMARDGKLVVRPDSGNPIDIICGLKEGSYRRTRDGVAYPLSAWDGAVFKGGAEPIPEHVIKGSIELLWDTFGGTVNDKGFKELDSHIGLIYGDSITLERQWAILERLAEKGFASSNVVLGIGSYTYNYSTRDTFGFAVKATATQVDDEFIELFKDPKTGDKLKKSARGLLVVEQEDGKFILRDQQPENVGVGLMTPVFSNGTAYPATLAEVRKTLLG